MPTIEKNTTVQELDPGDEITYNGVRGSVQSCTTGAIRITVANDEGMHILDLEPEDDLWIYEMDAPIAAVWIDEGDVVSGPVAGTVVNTERVNIEATVANSEGLTAYLFSGDEEITIHNYPMTGLADCEVCARGVHHGPKQARCPCCSSTLEMWGIDFTIPEDWDELTD